MKNSEKMLFYLEQQDLQKAMSYFQQALESDSDEVLLELAAYLESIGFLPQAKEIYLRLLEGYPELAIQLAQIANEDGSVEEAFGYLEMIAPDSPAYLEALVVKADLYQSEGLTDVAREKLLEASRLSDSPVIVFGLAELDLELQEYKEAIRYYAQLDHQEIQEWTGVSIYQRIGLAYASLGKFEVAIEFLEKSVELVYDDQTVFELATLLLDQGLYQKSALYFKQLDALNPEFEGYEYAYAQALHGEHQLTEARDMLAKGLNKNEYDPALLLLASQYAYEDHDVTAAEAYLLQAKRDSEDENEIVLRLSNLYLEQERYEEAISLYSEEVDHVLAIWNIARAYQALEYDEEAQVLFEQIRQDLAENPEFLVDYIELLRQIGDMQEAKDLAKQYLELVPDDLLMQEFYNQG